MASVAGTKPRAFFKQFSKTPQCFKNVLKCHLLLCILTSKALLEVNWLSNCRFWPYFLINKLNTVWVRKKQWKHSLGSVWFSQRSQWGRRVRLTYGAQTFSWGNNIRRISYKSKDVSQACFGSTLHAQLSSSVASMQYHNQCQRTNENENGK